MDNLEKEFIQAMFDLEEHFQSITGNQLQQQKFSYISAAQMQYLYPKQQTRLTPCCYSVALLLIYSLFKLDMIVQAVILKYMYY